MSGVLIVSNGESHVGRLTSVSVERKAALVTLIAEGAVSPIDVQIVRRGVIGHNDVGLTVVVDIGKQRIESVITVGTVHAQLPADVGKRAVAVVAEQVISPARQPAGPAHYLHAAVLAEAGGRGLRERSIAHIKTNIAGHKQVEISIAVVISKSGAGVVSGQRGRTFVQSYAGLHRDIGECAVVVVVIEAARTDIGYVEIGPAVIVVIADDATGSPSVIRHTGARSDVGERAVMVVVEEGCMR